MSREQNWPWVNSSYPYFSKNKSSKFGKDPWYDLNGWNGFSMGIRYFRCSYKHQVHIGYVWNEWNGMRIWQCPSTDYWCCWANLHGANDLHDLVLVWPLCLVIQILSISFVVDIIILTKWWLLSMLALKEQAYEISKGCVGLPLATT